MAWLSVFPALSQQKYADFVTLTRRINSLQGKYPQLCAVKSLTRTAGGRDIWLLTAGTGNRDGKPGIVICGGIEGNHLLGQELALGFAEKLLESSSQPEVKSILEKITFYVMPDLSPDGTERYFAATRYESVVNALPYDEDRDFLTDEDPCEDLNNDGLITQIRILDPSGHYLESSINKKVMVTADLSKGEKGEYLIFSEGIDNDEDGSYNEDGEGGVNFNNNLTCNYEEFGKNSGPYPVSEPETKAVLDFLFDRFNVFAVFTFGPQDNLGQPMKSPEPGENDRTRRQGSDEERAFRRRPTPTTHILKSDELINKMVSEKYHEITGAKGAPAESPAPGNFMDWAYYHYGRYSFSTPGWWFPIEKSETREEAFMKFAEKNKMEDVFVPWTEVRHPGFDGKKVEVGGIKPFFMINPPADTLVNLITAHYKFLIAISSLHPELEFLDIKSENVGGNIYRLSLKVHNKGLFATCTEMGDNNMWTKIMRIVLTPAKNQTIVSGLKTQRIPRLQGDDTAEFSWLISGKGNAAISAGAANTGFISTTVDLR
ncbi:MAG: peptidase [Bacteroidales bacterium]|nr:peptidase [Bacteroidales bacterium]